jgi:hypothetical protein
MVGDKLVELKNEISHYIGLPYFTNSRHLTADNVFVGKGTAKEIALKTIELANPEKIKLTDLTPKQLYNFQKKHHLGIDCSGLTCHLLNFYHNINLNVRKTSADMLTSAPLSSKIDTNLVATGDLVRQKNGHHLLFIIEKIGNSIYYVDSSFSGRGVRYGQFDLNDKTIPNQGIFRLNKSL